MFFVIVSPLAIELVIVSLLTIEPFLGLRPSNIGHERLSWVYRQPSKYSVRSA